MQLAYAPGSRTPRFLVLPPAGGEYTAAPLVLQTARPPHFLVMPSATPRFLMAPPAGGEHPAAAAAESAAARSAWLGGCVFYCGGCVACGAMMVIALFV